LNLWSAATSFREYAARRSSARIVSAGWGVGRSSANASLGCAGQPFRFRREATALLVGEPHSFALELLFEHADFLNGIPDQVLLLAFQSSGERREQHLQREDIGSNAETVEDAIVQRESAPLATVT